jgi:hypothetical protein
MRNGNFLIQFKKYSIKTTGVIATFGRNELQRNFLAFIDKFILNYICLDSWKYISFGIAEK